MFNLLINQKLITPNRTFFIWDADKDIAHVSQTLCLQQLGISITPSLMIVGVFKHYPTGETFMSSALRLYWVGQMSVEEMEQFIDVFTPDLKQSLLLK